jgi:hypothetical protein
MDVSYESRHQSADDITIWMRVSGPCRQLLLTNCLYSECVCVSYLSLSVVIIIWSAYTPYTSNWVGKSRVPALYTSYFTPLVTNGITPCTSKTEEFTAHAQYLLSCCT